MEKKLQKLSQKPSVGGRAPYPLDFLSSIHIHSWQQEKAPSRSAQGGSLRAREPIDAYLQSNTVQRAPFGYRLVSYLHRYVIARAYQRAYLYLRLSYVSTSTQRQEP